MPSGRYINVIERNQIVDNLHSGRNVDYIYNSVFNSDANKVLRLNLKRLCSEIQNLDNVE